MVLYFMFALIHARLDLLSHFMLISLFASLGLIWGICVLLLISCDFGWLGL